MIKGTSSKRGSTLTIHPFFAAVFRRVMNWRNGISLAEIEAYITRLNERMARANRNGDTTPVTLHQLAPLIVATIAVLANAGIALHLGFKSHQLPPLQALYNEALEALHDPDGILGEKFATDARTLVDELYQERRPLVEGYTKAHTPTVVPRDALSGLPLAAFVQHQK
ncbi:hypothetical protein H9P43_006208 [Blastocladiella emersonii ATCC 22665]|nr:hypothetical protein H9P43_006208 [Blastocladiella emersonii ATCC 22665]